MKTIFGKIRELDLDNRSGRIEGTAEGEPYYPRENARFHYFHTADEWILKSFQDQSEITLAIDENGYIASDSPIEGQEAALYRKLYVACEHLAFTAVDYPEQVNERIGRIAAIAKEIRKKNEQSQALK